MRGCTEDSVVLDARPAPDDALPADDARVDPAVRANERVAHHNRPLDADAVLQAHSWPDAHVRPDTTAATEARTRVNQHVPSYLAPCTHRRQTHCDRQVRVCTL